MNSQRDCWEALIEGKKLTNGYDVVRFLSGELVDQLGRPREYNFVDYNHWNIVVPTYTIEHIRAAYKSVCQGNVLINIDLIEKELKKYENGT